jgi:hypothetical protein
MIEPYAPVAAGVAGEGAEVEEVAGVEEDEDEESVFATGNVLGVVLVLLGDAVFEDEVELSNPSIIPLPNPPYLKYPAALTSNTTTKINIVVILSKCIFLFY